MVLEDAASKNAVSTGKFLVDGPHAVYRLLYSYGSERAYHGSCAKARRNGTPCWLHGIVVNYRVMSSDR